MKKIILIFSLAFILNLIWENLHAVLYVSYKGGEITRFILARASLFDAILIVIMSWPLIYFAPLKNKFWLIMPLGIIIAIFNEWYGLGTGRWVYDTLMPIIPIIKTGLSPTLQLGLLGYISIKLSEYLRVF